MIASKVCRYTLAAFCLHAAAARAQEVQPTTPSDTVAPPAVQAEADRAGSPQAPAEAVGAAQAEGETSGAAGANELTELRSDELAALGIETGAGGAGAVDTSLHLSGFMDVTFSGMKAPDDSFFRGMFNRHASFWLGNINLYVSKNITESVRTMFEVRFTYMPNGVPNSGFGTGLLNTSVSDYTDAGHPQRWGGIIMQRAHLDWELHSAAILRVGQYLTPYGIWNVDHGSPTIVPVLRPYIVGAQMFPERQTGLQLFGGYSPSAHNTFSYALTLSNGFGPLSEYRDLDNNTAFGGHLAWSFDGLGELTLGGSWFLGKDTSAYERLIVKPGGKLSSAETISQQSNVLALAADLQWKYEGLLVQSEVITQQREFTEAGRVGAVNVAAGNQYLAPKDATSWGFYGLMGYRLPALGVMPYVLCTYNAVYELSTLTFGKALALEAGLNIRPIDAVVLKLEYATVKLVGSNAPTNDRLHTLQAQLAWAF